MNYYEENAQKFYERTINFDMKERYATFEPHLPKSAKILEVGSGAGRDAKYFSERAHDVTAIDPSPSMVAFTSKELGKPALEMRVQEIEFDGEFDAIWCSASLLHISYEEHRSVYEKLYRALRPSGVLYANYKYGDTHRNVKGRDFYDMDESKILPYLEGLFTPIEIWKNNDTPGRIAPSPANAWLNVLCSKSR
ncbi:MAG: class I SAM-dependent methyltransferase [Simkaniaceae bacterium]|nr:class I SAM-dependent methyltransferase [Simkaniaceae bacterium]